jgi:hypothetical protein
MRNHGKPSKWQWCWFHSDLTIFGTFLHWKVTCSELTCSNWWSEGFGQHKQEELRNLLDISFFSTGTNANAAKGPSYMIWDLKDAALVQHHPTKAEFDFDCLIPANFRSIVPEMMLQSVGGIWYCSVYRFFLCFGQRYSESRYLVLCPACRARRSTSGSTARST